MLSRSLTIFIAALMIFSFGAEASMFPRKIITYDLDYDVDDRIEGSDSSRGQHHG